MELLQGYAAMRGDNDVIKGTFDLEWHKEVVMARDSRELRQTTIQEFLPRRCGRLDLCRYMYFCAASLSWTFTVLFALQMYSVQLCRKTKRWYLRVANYLLKTVLTKPLALGALPH